MTEKYCFGKKRLKKGGMWSKNQLCYIFYYWHLINAFLCLTYLVVDFLYDVQCVIDITRM